MCPKQDLTLAAQVLLPSSWCFGLQAGGEIPAQVSPGQRTCPATQELETLRNKKLGGIISHISICFDMRKCSFIDVAVTLLSLMPSFKSLFSLGFICLVITVS